MSLSRTLAVCALVWQAGAATGAEPPAASLSFPADYGSHPAFRTEWWYVTGWLSTAEGDPLGFQVTFFRTRPGLADDNPSAFAPRQLIIAHAAISDPGRGRLYQDQLIQRAVLGLADAATADTDVRVEHWRLVRHGEGYDAEVAADDFALQLHLATSQAPLVNGDHGQSRKGAAPAATSWYYSVPHLIVSGTSQRGGRTDTVRGEAWLDHEWSNEYLEPGAAGWDWIGIDLDDGGALMAFRIRGADGAPRWAGATLRHSDGSVQTFTPADVAFEPGRTWTSPRTAVRYPVEWRVRVGTRELTLQPLMDDQESDTRRSSGTLYWEGAVRALEGARVTGRGYLELTGYGEPLRLP